MSISTNFANELSPSLKAFHAKLERLLALVRFTESAIMLRPRLGAMIDRQQLGDPYVTMLDRFLDAKDVGDEEVIDSALAMAYGAFEDVIRKFIEASVRSINQSQRDPSKLPETFQIEHIYRTGRILATVKRPVDHFDFEFLDLGRNLASCGGASSKYVLNATSFSFEHGILTVEALNRLFRRLGIDIDWDLIGADKAIKQLLGESKTRACTKAVKMRIDEIVRSRNYVCHTGMADATRSSEWTVSTLEFLKSLVDALARSAAKSLTRKY